MRFKINGVPVEGDLNTVIDVEAVHRGYRHYTDGVEAVRERVHLDVTLDRKDLQVFNRDSSPGQATDDINVVISKKLETPNEFITAFKNLMGDFQKCIVHREAAAQQKLESKQDRPLDLMSVLRQAQAGIDGHRAELDEDSDAYRHLHKLDRRISRILSDLEEDDDDDYYYEED